MIEWARRERIAMRATYIIELKKKKLWHWVLRAGNGRVLANSPEFKTKFHCRKTALRVRFDLCQSKGVEALYEEHA